MIKITQGRSAAALRRTVMQIPADPARRWWRAGALFGPALFLCTHVLIMMWRDWAPYPAGEPYFYLYLIAVMTLICGVKWLGLEQGRRLLFVVLVMIPLQLVFSVAAMVCCALLLGVAR